MGLSWKTWLRSFPKGPEQGGTEQKNLARTSLRGLSKADQKKVTTFQQIRRRLVQFYRGFPFSRVLAKKKHLWLEKKQIALLGHSLK